jgi:hypothetical protein
MFKLLVIAACKTGMTSKVIDFDTHDARLAAAMEIETQSYRIGEVVCICL